MPSPLAEWDKKYVWHPFTQHAEWERREPIIIQSARGVWLKDSRGRRLLDGVSSLWVNVFGHRKRELDRALQRQLGRIAHSTFLGLTHEPAIRLAKKLVEISPAGLSRVFYSDNGSTAVEVALKMAYQYGQLRGQRSKSKFVSLQQGYHGDTVGSVSVGGIDLFHARFRDLLFKGWQVKPGDFEAVKQLLAKRHSQIAAVVMEPLIQGASGMLVMPQGYLAHVARLCKRYDVLLIADEVATGFGRTGTMFAVEQEQVKPDFLCVAKSITGGYLPLAATLTTERIYKAFLGRYDQFKAFFHGHTYTANPLACAVALATLELYKKEGLLRHIQARAKELAEGLGPLKDHPHVKEIRQVGLMVGIELIQKKGDPLSLTLPREGGGDFRSLSLSGRGRGERAYPPARRMGLKVCDAALKHGLWLRPLGDVVVLMPPLAISKKELQFLLQGVRLSVEEATR